MNVLLDQNVIQIGYSGADVVDLCMVLDFGRLDSLNSCYDTNRNYMISNWDQYKSKRQRFSEIILQDLIMILVSVQSVKQIVGLDFLVK